VEILKTVLTKDLTTHGRWYTHVHGSTVRQLPLWFQLHVLRCSVINVNTILCYILIYYVPINLPFSVSYNCILSAAILINFGNGNTEKRIVF